MTLDDVTDVASCVDAVSSSSRRLTARIVLDPADTLSAYDQAIARLHPHASLMGQVIDSDFMARFTPARAGVRARDCLRRFGSRVDVWEIGNELNGAWVGRDPASIIAVAAAMFDVMHPAGAATALTLNYWADPRCYDQSWEATLDFARRLPPRMLQGCDYVLLSVYETACDPAQQPTAADLAATLQSLGRLFPTARLGIGEIGAQNRSDGLPTDPSLATRQTIARRYIGMHAELAARVGRRYAGGYFWWYYAEDAVPRNRPGSLWPTIDQLYARI